LRGAQRRLVKTSRYHKEIGGRIAIDIRTKHEHRSLMFSKEREMIRTIVEKAAALVSIALLIAV
jgi:hypothetical protein